MKGREAEVKSTQIFEENFSALYDSSSKVSRINESFAHF